MGILLLFALHVQAQKPEVKVSFDIATNNLFFEIFESDIDEMKNNALPILIDGLNEYIGFVSFFKESASNELTITLKNKNVGSTGFNEEYWLFFELKDQEDSVFTHEWQFLDYEEFDAYQSSAIMMLDKLQEDWKAYLNKSYNQELVSILFDKISITIPDSDHYYIDNTSGIKEAILPFKKEALMMEPIDSEFKVIVNGKTNNGVHTISKHEEAQFSGVVQENMTSIPLPLMGCLRIQLKELPVMELINGKIFVTKYRRKVYSTIATSSEFFESNIE
ncbi:hypothetical protein [uncultured Aquimarina sp.]|uniref:hypothetical protein n=1 Tax=uncultured Aquimarina sp. TaxID=575652 RepID=UPI0026111423|nr:hypothetical protein [uncultured Aquimarina sp.]